MKPYIRSIPKTWWLGQRSYLLFMIREFTSVFIAGYCIFLLIFIYKLGQGPEVYGGIIDFLSSPLSIVLHIAALIFAIYHSVTWFNLTPQVLVLRIGEEKIPAFLISGANIVAWLLLSAIVAWIILVV
ncbi:MAG: fumarate reductase subunit C [Thermodesulfobacteriota bacterium]